MNKFSILFDFTHDSDGKKILSLLAKKKTTRLLLLNIWLKKKLTSLIIARFEHALEQTMNRYTKLRSVLILDLIFLKNI